MLQDRKDTEDGMDAWASIPSEWEDSGGSALFDVYESWQHGKCMLCAGQSGNSSGMT
jgi:hypothetical protein